MLGQSPAQNKLRSSPLRSELAERWSHIIQTGLTPEERAELLLLYPVPENCDCFVPPLLNVELTRALPDSGKIRDQRICKKQERLSACLTSIGHALSLCLEEKDSPNMALIKSLSDVGRLLADTFHEETVVRRSLVLSNVNITLKDTLITTPADSFLFGDKLSDNVKVAKQIDSTAKELKTTKPIQKVSKNFRAPPHHALKSRAPVQGGPQTSRPTFYRQQRQSRPRSRTSYRPRQRSPRRQLSRRR